MLFIRNENGSHFHLERPQDMGIVTQKLEGSMAKTPEPRQAPPASPVSCPQRQRITTADLMQGAREIIVLHQGADHYPHRLSKRLATRQPSTSNVKSRRPRHKVRTPGIPSLRRFRCPPRRPIHKTACPSVSLNTARPWPNLATKTAHSSSLSNTVAGASGSCCARSRNATIRAATLVYITIAFSKLSHFSSRRSSIRQPLFSVR